MIESRVKKEKNERTNERVVIFIIIGDFKSPRV